MIVAISIVLTALAAVVLYLLGLFTGMKLIDKEVTPSNFVYCNIYDAFNRIYAIPVKDRELFHESFKKFSAMIVEVSEQEKDIILDSFFAQWVNYEIATVHLLAHNMNYPSKPLFAKIN